MPTRARRLFIAALVLVAALVGDQLSKQWAHATLSGQPNRVLVDGVLEFDFAFNTGSAFGMFASMPGARVVFIVTTTLALFYMGALLWRLPGEPRSARADWMGTCGLALMAGGALGNLVDRLTRLHDVRVSFAERPPFWMIIDHPQEYADALFRGRSVALVPRHGVVDFIVVYLPPPWSPGTRWPSFNLADTWLVVGVALLMIYLARNGSRS